MSSTLLTMNRLMTVALFVAACFGVILGQCRYPQYVSVDPITSATALTAAPTDVNTLLQLATLINKIENCDKNDRISSDDIITKLIDALILVATKNKGGRDLLNIELGGNDLLTLL